MLWYDEYGYYTYEQLLEAFAYVKTEDPTDDKYHKNRLHDHLHQILKQMKHYQMEIILARDILRYGEFENAMIELYRILPISFKSKSNEYLNRVISAPNYKEAKFCGNCKHFDDRTDYDDMLHGVCCIHTEIDVEYDPPLKSPLDLSCYSVCDDFEFREGI